MVNPFLELGLPDVLATTLQANGIAAPFPIQTSTIPDALAGRDVSGRAPTGSGKTLAFGLPMLARVPTAAPNRPPAMVLAPTRELAAQIRLDLAPYGKAMNRQVFAVFGGVRYTQQKAFLRRGVDILVATPGRLEDLIEQGAVDLSDVGIVTVDEADRMADMGFLPDVRRILDQTRVDRQTLLFSATLDGPVGALIRDYQHDPVTHTAEPIEPETTDAEHHFWLVDGSEKIRHAADIVRISDRSIVFARTRIGVDELARKLTRHGIKAVAMHGGLSQNQRTRALRAFAQGDAQALVATDVAARGIHIDAVASVVHFDPPEEPKDYIHRSGRTARAGASGNIVSLVTSAQRRSVRRMQDKLGMQIPIGKPELGALHDHHLSAMRERRPKSPPRRVKTSNAGRRKQRPSDAPRAQETTRRGNWPAPRPARKPDPTPPGARTIHVSNLPWKATDADVEALFAKHGRVIQSTVMIDNRGRSKGYALVDMPRAEAPRAADAVNGELLDGRPVTARLSH